MNANQPSLLRRFLAWSLICACGVVIFLGAAFVAAESGLLPSSVTDAFEFAAGAEDCG